MVADRDSDLGRVLVEAGRRPASRGYDSVGCATVSRSGDMDPRKDAGKIDAAEKRLRLSEMRGCRGIVQLRMAWDELYYYLAVPRAVQLLNPILATIPAQLMAYHVAAGRGIDPDFQRNLSKTLTVD